MVPDRTDAPDRFFPTSGRKERRVDESEKNVAIATTASLPTRQLLTPLLCHPCPILLLLLVAGSVFSCAAWSP